MIHLVNEKNFESKRGRKGKRERKKEVSEKKKTEEIGSKRIEGAGKEK